MIGWHVLGAHSLFDVHGLPAFGGPTQAFALAQPTRISSQRAVPLMAPAPKSTSGTVKTPPETEIPG
jgi:hypothetical protein